MGAGWSCHDTRGPILPAHRPHGDRDCRRSTLSLRTLSNGASEPPHPVTQMPALGRATRWHSASRTDGDGTVSRALRGDSEGPAAAGTSPRQGQGPDRGPSVPGEGTTPPSHHPVPHCLHPGLRVPGKHSLQGPSPHNPGRMESETRAAYPQNRNAGGSCSQISGAQAGG